MGGYMGGQSWVYSHSWEERCLNMKRRWLLCISSRGMATYSRTTLHLLLRPCVSRNHVTCLDLNLYLKPFPQTFQFLFMSDGPAPSSDNWFHFWCNSPFWKRLKIPDEILLCHMNAQNQGPTIPRIKQTMHSSIHRGQQLINMHKHTTAHACIHTRWPWTSPSSVVVWPGSRWQICTRSAADPRLPDR